MPRGMSETAGLVDRARRAQARWSELDAQTRADALRPLARRILAAAERIATTIAEETGKPLEEAVLAEVLPNADLVDYWCDTISEALAPDTIELDPISYPGKSGRVQRVARGVVALITPWNYPVAIPLRTLVPALLSGCAVIWKPSEHTPRCADVVRELFQGLFDEDLLIVAHGDGAVGAELVKSEVDSVVFTGSVATGKRVGVVCAERLVPCSLELGGKDAAIVLADAPVERTARGLVWGAFTNAGQNCASIERVYVVESIAAKLIERVVALSRELDPARDLGRMTTAAQAEIVRAQLEEAGEHGELLVGAQPEKGSLTIAPVVIKLRDEDCALMRDETFGPVLPIVVVADEEAAIAAANRSRFGLTASIWTGDVTRAHGVAARLRAGVVTINNHAFSAAIPAAPWTGVGDSGTGVTNGPFALSAFVRPRLVLEDRNAQKSEVWWYPYDDTLRSIAFGMARLKGGVGVAGRVGALFSLATLLPKRLFGGKKPRPQSELPASPPKS